MHDIWQKLNIFRLYQEKNIQTVHFFYLEKLKLRIFILDIKIRHKKRREPLIFLLIEEKRGYGIKMRSRANKSVKERKNDNEAVQEC